MSRVPLLVVGAGGHGRVVADAAVAAGFDVVAFADDARVGQSVLGAPCIAMQPELIAATARGAGAHVVVAIGDNRARERMQGLLAQKGLELASVIHPSSVVSRHASIGAGSVVLARAVVGVAAVIGEGVIINHGASVDHDSRVLDFAHLSPGVHMGGEVTIGRGAHLAVGVSVRNRVHVGDWSVVGVGAAVIKDLPGSVVALGVPARVVRGIDEPR